MVLPSSEVNCYSPMLVFLGRCLWAVNGGQLRRYSLLLVLLKVRDLLKSLASSKEAAQCGGG